MIENLKIGIISNSGLSSLENSLRYYSDRLPKVEMIVFSEKENKNLRQLTSNYEYYQLPSIPDERDYQLIRSELGEYVDTFFVFSTRLIPSLIFDYYKCINFHPSKLPLYPGLHGLRNSIINFHLGFTSHFIDCTVDMGKIIETLQITPFPSEFDVTKIKHISSRMCSLMIHIVLKKIYLNQLNNSNIISYQASTFEELEGIVL